MGRYFLGVDGGQSSTDVLIGDASGRVLGEGEGRTGRITWAAPKGVRGRVRAVTDAVGGACVQAGLSWDEVEFEAACLGFTGGPDGKEPILREILRCRRLLILDDSEIALAGAHGRRSGYRDDPAERDASR